MDVQPAMLSAPQEAISMVEDEEGFEYPQIDESKRTSEREHMEARIDHLADFVEVHSKMTWILKLSWLNRYTMTA